MKSYGSEVALLAPTYEGMM